MEKIKKKQNKDLELSEKEEQEKKEVVEKPKEANKKEKTNEKLAIIRIRGIVGINKKIKDTLGMLRLYRKNRCVVVDKTPTYVGMVKIVKDYVTYGEIDKETLEKLMKKEKKDKKGKTKAFALNPPKGGFERKGIKVSYRAGGVLGYRAEKINDLIKKML